MVTWSPEGLTMGVPYPVRVHLSGGPADGESFDVEGEWRNFLVPSVGDPPAGKTLYVRTRQHTGGGLRVYTPLGESWPANRSLGWVGPDWAEVETDYDPAAVLWRVTLRGNGHAVSFELAALDVGTGTHLAAMDRVAARLARAGRRGRAAAG